MAFLPQLLAWSREHGFPFYFSTEASLNLADDPKLLAMMEAVDFRYLFVGIETADKDLLIRTQKKQNTRNPIAEAVHRLNAHGMVVTAGFILGFDGESRGAASVDHRLRGGGRHSHGDGRAAHRAPPHAAHAAARA